MKIFRLGLLLGFMPVFPLAAQGDFHLPLKAYGYNTTPALQDRAVLDSLQRWEEHITLHTDRAAADPGDYIFFKAFATTGPNRVLFSPSGVLKVELLNTEKEVVSTQYYPLSAGTADGALQIPDKLEPGAYTLRAYTRWMRNYGPTYFYTTSLQIGSLPAISGEAGESPTIATVEFQPEGGELISGISNNLAIVTRDAHGCPVAVRGEIANASGTQRIPVQSFGAGYASALFEPQAGEQYRLQLENGDAYSLPEVAASGYALRVNNLDPARIRVRIEAAATSLTRSLTLLGRQGLHTVFEQSVTLDHNRQAELDIPTAGLPAGTLNLVLLDAGGEEQALRPVQIEGASQLRIELSPMAADFSRGAETAFRLRVTDSQGRPVQASLSLAVTAAPNTGVPQNGPFLSGPAAAENHTGTQNQARFLSDLKILGDYNSALSMELPDAIRYRVQQGLELIGYAYDLNNNLLRNTRIQVIGSADNALVLDEITTDGSGVLKLTNLNLYGVTSLVFRTNGDETRERLVRIEPLSPKKDPDGANEKEKATRKKEAMVETTPWLEMDTTGLIALNEAVVKAKKLEQKASPSTYGVVPDNTVYQDPKRPVSTEILLSRIPGVSVSGDLNMNPRITLPMRIVGTMAPVLWVVDGLVLGQQGIDGHPFAMIPSTDIERIELVSGAAAAIFGSRGAGGVFLLYTRSGAGLDYIRRKDAQLVFKGYEPRLDFDAYLALRQDDRQLRKAAPATLYWNPAVETDANGEAVVRFRSPGDYSKVQVTAETVTPDGKVGRAQKVF